MNLDRNKLVRSAEPIYDASVERHIEKASIFSRAWLDDSESSRIFFDEALSWIAPFLGKNSLESFRTRVLTAGTTGSFLDFYHLNFDRRLKVLKGEYPFHRDVFYSLKTNWNWLVVDELEHKDFVIISVPFSGDGSLHPKFFEILDRCEELQAPVLLDCAFAGLSDLPLPKIDHYQCIKKIAFSLSKIFNIGLLRCGFEFSRYEFGANYVLNQWDYGQKAAAEIGLKLMREFPLDYIFKKYRERQLNLCEQLNLTPSSTVLFGLGDESWQEFGRDGYANRVCLSELLRIDGN